MTTIVNITATFSVRGPVKIPKTAKYKYYFTKKSQDLIQFPGAIYKNFGHTFILYKSGKIICIGGKNLSVLEEICKKVAKIVNGLSRIYDFEVKNLVGVRSLNSFLDLHTTAESIKGTNIRICYDPELFAAIHVYTDKCLVILFHTGKVIFTGGKTTQQINEAWNLVKQYLVWK